MDYKPKTVRPESAEESLTLDKLLEVKAKLDDLTFTSYYPTHIRASESMAADTALLFETGLLIVAESREQEARSEGDPLNWLLTEMQAGRLKVLRMPEYRPSWMGARR